MRVAIIGGDRRMLYAAKAFVESGDEVRAAGFDEPDSFDMIMRARDEDAIFWADIVVLPVRPVNDGFLTAPFAKEPILIERICGAIGQRPVFCGSADSIRGRISGRLYDYAAREEFSIRNAVLTAEGTIGLLIGEHQGSLFGAKALVLGYGRIGRVLARYLRALGAEVTVAVRRESSRAWAQAEGLNTSDYSFKEIYQYDLIINSVPALVLTGDRIDRIRPDALIVDLASLPGGVDRKRAEERDVRCIHALALPGKTAPAAAGQIIKDTICNIIKEENGGKDHSGLCDDRLLLHL